MRQELDSNFPYGDSRAAALLRGALDRAHRERRLSIRALGKLLGYKQATVLSHMAHGRVAVPIERAPEIARAVNLDPAEFFVAALEQRVPDAGNLLLPLLASSRSSSAFAAELESVAGLPLDALPEEHREVIKEVVSDRAPRRRWLTLAELPTVSEIRNTRPDFPQRGLSSLDLNGISGFLAED